MTEINELCRVIQMKHPDLVRKLHLNVAAELVDFSHQASPLGPSSDKRDGFWSL